MYENVEYTRWSAKVGKWHKYHSTLRPVGVGTQPRKGFVDFINYGERKEVNGHMVWSELYYCRKLSEDELKQYELIEGENEWETETT